jgi:toxin-antitoxin system PIN domain toxin
MSALCDANVLLAICHEAHLHHRAALGWLDRQESRSVAVCRATQTTLLRLLTTQTVMGTQVRTMAGAWAIYDALQADDRFLFTTEPTGTETIWRDYTHGEIVSPKLWQDAYLAAFATRAGMEMVTFDRGFRQFEGLALVLLS